MALADLLATLERDALAQLARDRESAEAEAARIRAEAEALAERRRAEARATLTARLDAERGHAVALATQRVQREVFAAREAAVQRVLARARELCREPAPPAAQPALVALALTGLRYLERGPVEARGDPALLTALRAALNGQREVTPVPDSTVGQGLALRAAGGRARVDATLLGRLDHREDEARAFVVLRLEGAAP
jgi:vacuolar-type H+-ATPase subunit E/Vma4